MESSHLHVYWQHMRGQKCAMGPCLVTSHGDSLGAGSMYCSPLQGDL